MCRGPKYLENFQKSKKKFFAPRKRRLFGSIENGSRSFLGIRQQAHSIFEKAKIFFARCARGETRFARSTFLALNRREKLATFFFLTRQKSLFARAPPSKSLRDFSVRASLANSLASLAPRLRELVRLTKKSEKNAWYV